MFQRKDKGNPICEWEPETEERALRVLSSHYLDLDILVEDMKRNPECIAQSQFAYYRYVVDPS